ncbi:hypothetical protein KI387_042948, partial [Taxus chinensis]
TIPESREEINLEEHDFQLLLSLGGRDRRPKVAKTTSRLIIEESGQKFAELSVPAEGKHKGELTAADIAVTKVPIGQTTTEGLKQDTQTLMNALFLKLDKEKAERSKLQKQVFQLCEIIAKVAKPSSQPILAHEQVSNHLMQEVEDAGDQVRAIAHWKEQIIHQASEQFEPIPAELENMHRAVSQLKDLMTQIKDENIVAESHLDTLAKIHSLPKDVLIAEQIVLGGLVEKGKQLEISVSFRVEILKLMLKRMQLLESKMGEVPGSIPDELPASHEEFMLVVRKEVDEATIPFTMDSIGRLIKLQADIEGYGPGLEKVKANIVALSRGLLQFRTERDAIVKTDGKMLNYMFD